MAESSWGAGDFWVKNAHGEFLNIIDFIFLSNEETKVGIAFAEFLEFRSDGSDVEFLIEFSRAIFKGLVMEENYIWFWKLFACFFWNPNV